MRIKTILTGTLVVVMLIGVLALASGRGELCCQFNPADAWGIDNGDESSRYTDPIAPYLRGRLRIVVDPYRGLDVGVILFVCVDYTWGTECKPLAGVDRGGCGWRETLRYYVDPDDFSLTEILLGYWIVGVFAVNERCCCDIYDIEIDFYR